MLSLLLLLLFSLSAIVIMSQGGECATSCIKLTKEREEKLVLRLHDQSIEHKQETLKKLDSRFYPIGEPKRISKSAVEGSVTRQVDREMEKRRLAREEYEARALRESMPKKISSSVVLESAERLHTQSIKHKEASMEEARKRYLFSGPPAAKKNSREIQEYVTRLAVPKKREFTVEEINRVYGLA